MSYALVLGFVKSAVEEMNAPSDDAFPETARITDGAAQQLMSLLVNETGEGGPMGRVYSEHLAHALFARLFMLESTEHESKRSQQSKLPRHLLGRVLARTHEFDHRVSLQSLAAETGYSRSHFVPMFRMTTGQSSHQYLLQLRLRRAQELLRSLFGSLIDIAANCGFSSHAHLSRMFRRHLGVTPSEFRRAG